MKKSLYPSKKLTKEEIIKEIEDYGCGKLEKLPLNNMTKKTIIEHLETCKCPKLKQLKKDLHI